MSLAPPQQRAGAAAERPTRLGTRADPEYGSDALVDVLRALGHRYLPMNPGSSFRGLHDSVVNHGGNVDPQLLLCLHEEIAVSLAHGYAKATGGAAVVAAHDLVGLMHASMAIYNAFCDRTPLVVVGGSGPADTALRRPADWLHSATTQAALVRDYVKWHTEPTTAPEALMSMVRAQQQALSGPRGPVYISLDAEMQERPLHEPLSVPDLVRYSPPPPMAPEQVVVERAADLLVAAKDPVVVGGRVAREQSATSALVELVERLGAAYRDDRNLVAFPTNHPQNCSGDPALLRDADVVVALDVVDLTALLGGHAGADRTPAGSPVGGPTVVDVSLGDLALPSWSHAFGPPVPRDVHVAGDPRVGLQHLTDAVAARVGATDRRDRRNAVARRHAALRARRRQETAARWDDSPVSPARLVAETWAAVRDLDWLLVLRNTRTWPEGVWEFTGAGQYLGHSGGGGVGYGPGAMVGGALAARDRGQLGVAIVGDGDLLMAAGALWTAVHYRIPLLAVVNDNGSFYNDEPHQRDVARCRGRSEDNAWIGMRIADPPVDIAALARSYGWWAQGPVADPRHLAPALRAAREAAAGGAVAVVHVRTMPR